MTLRADDVGDRDDLRTALAGLPHACERVGGLAGLGDRDDERLVVDDRIVVAELARDLDLHRDARPLLDEVLGHEPGVVARAAGDDEDPLDARDLLGGHGELGELDLVRRSCARAASRAAPWAARRSP